MRRTHPRLSMLVPLGVALLFVAAMASFHPGLHVFGVFKDEGYNWIKAHLVADGHKLYGEIWSDQPPGLTWLLAAWCGVAGWGVATARLFALLWSGALLFAVGDILRRECGVVPALLGMAALVCSQQYLALSSALLIGLPAVAAAALSLWALTRWCASHRNRWVALSGVLLGLSVTIKLFTAFLIPIVVWWLVTHGRKASARRWMPGAIWLSSLVVLLGGALLAAGDPSTLREMLLGTHLDAHRSMDMLPGWREVLRFAWRDAGLFLLAGVGLVTSWSIDRGRPRVSTLLGAWLVAGTLVLACHRPVWGHHVLLLTAPAAALAGAAWRSDTPRGRPRLRLLAVVALTLLLGVTAIRDRVTWVPRDDAAAWAMSRQMRSFRDLGSGAVVGTPIFLAHADLRTPPEVAVSSLKRFATGRLGGRTIAGVIDAQRPEQVLLTPDFPREVRDHVRHALLEEYERTAWLPEAGLELFVRRELLPGGAAPPPTAAELASQPDAWFASEEGILATKLLAAWQNPDGGWPKGGSGISTFDNGLTVTEIRVLARAFRLVRQPEAHRAVETGLDYVLAAAYPTGGWPQCHPPPADYRRAVTFNDDAMVNVLELLEDVSADEGFAFVGHDRRRRAREAFELGLDCLLRCQIRVDGVPTGWAQQYDPVSLVPVAGRSYEPPAIAARETARVASFLMGLDAPEPAVRRAVHAAVSWLEASGITGRRLQVTPADVVVVDDPNAPALWSRFYDIATNRPVYAGRDGVIRYSLADIEPERRTGYDWLGRWGAGVLDAYPDWVGRHGGEGR